MRKIYTRKPPEERFWKHVKKTDSCWLWTATKDKRGYGRLNRFVDDKKQVPILAHRLSVMIHGVSLLDSDCVLHKCDNPSCVNPEHLFIGDRAENVRDMIQKDRMPRGEKRGHSKLTETDVIKIKDSLRWMSHTQTQLASMYGVTLSVINGIKLGTRWKHISK